jgi:hypothetical protein
MRLPLASAEEKAATELQLPTSLHYPVNGTTTTFESLSVTA